MLDLIIKLHSPNAVSLQGQFCRRIPYIKPTETMDSSNLLTATLDNYNNSCNSIKHKTSNQCCFNIGPALNEQRVKSMCLLGTLKVLLFNKPIYVYSKVQIPVGKCANTCASMKGACRKYLSTQVHNCASTKYASAYASICRIHSTEVHKYTSTYASTCAST